MRPFKKITRPRKAWLITWESSRRDYLAQLKRPKIVCILDSRLHHNSIRRLLPALYCSEMNFLLSDKIAYGACREVQKRQMMKDNHNELIHYGQNPWLFARKVENLYVEALRFTQVLRWTELPRYKFFEEKMEFIETVPRRANSFSQRYRYHVDYDY